MPPEFDTSVHEGESKEQYRNRMAEGLTLQHKWFRNGLTTGKIPVVMDVDDFGFLLPGYDDLLRIKKSLPDFRVTAFTIPLPKELFGENAQHYSKEKYKKWADIINKLDWLEVAIHGFVHTHNEMEVGYDKAIRTIESVELMFEEMGLRYAKIFKAPYWQYSYDALVALKDKGYLVALDRNHPRPAPEGLKTYFYNWSFEEPLPVAPVVKGHGHFTGRNTNNISDTLANILHHLPKETRFMTVGEYQQKYGTERKDELGNERLNDSQAPNGSGSLAGGGRGKDQ